MEVAKDVEGVEVEAEPVEGEGWVGTARCLRGDCVGVGSNWEGGVEVHATQPMRDKASQNNVRRRFFTGLFYLLLKRLERKDKASTGW